MSTKSSISHDNNYHLYEEIFDDKNVWLSILNNNGNLEFEVSKDHLKVCIKKKDFEKMIQEYLKNKLGLKNE